MKNQAERELIFLIRNNIIEFDTILALAIAYQEEFLVKASRCYFGDLGRAELKREINLIPLFERQQRFLKDFSGINYHTSNANFSYDLICALKDLITELALASAILKGCKVQNYQRKIHRKIKKDLLYKATNSIALARFWLGKLDS